MIKQAIIPLAGLGTRLLPLTSVFAKELLPINGKPGIEYIIEECIDAGIKEIILPDHNRKDLEDVPEHVAKDLTFHFAKEITDVLKIAVPDVFNDRKKTNNSKKK